MNELFENTPPPPPPPHQADLIDYLARFKFTGDLCRALRTRKFTKEECDRFRRFADFNFQLKKSEAGAVL